jgi:Ca2+-binding EF-hand superfamily protein
MASRFDMRARTTRSRFAWASAALVAALPGPAALAQQAGGETTELSFLAADTTGDGVVDEGELAADQAKRFAQLDADGDGSPAPADLAEHDAASFAAIDRDGDGRLSFEEVMAAKMADFAGADADRDGRLSYEEVAAFEARSE